MIKYQKFHFSNSAKTLVLAMLFATPTYYDVGEKFTLSELETMESDETYSIDEIKTDLLVMNFWNIGCKGCIQEQPFLNKLYDLFKSESITFWSVTSSKKENILSHLEKHPIKWEIKGDVDFMGLFGNDKMNIRCMPTTIVINSEKEILYAQCGPILDDVRGSEFMKLLRSGEPWR